MKNKGFSLIELIVAIGVFSVVMLIALVAIFALTDVNRNVQENRRMVDNIDFVLDDISRNIASSDIYHCYDGSGMLSASTLTVSDCAGGDTAIAFIHTKDSTIRAYRFVESDGIGTIQVSDDGANFSRMTNSDVDVDHLSFFVSGSDYRDGVYSNVHIRLSAKSIGDESKIINLQTNVAQRVSDF